MSWSKGRHRRTPRHVRVPVALVGVAAVVGVSAASAIVIPGLLAFGICCVLSGLVVWRLR